MSEKKNVKVSFKNGKIEAECDGKTKTFINPITNPTNGGNIMSNKEEHVKNTSTVNMMETEYNFGFQEFANSNYMNRSLRSFNNIVRSMTATSYFCPELKSICVAELFDPENTNMLLEAAETINKCACLMRKYAPIIAYNQMEQRTDYAYGEFLSRMQKAFNDNDAVQMRRAVITLFIHTVEAMDQTAHEVDVLMCMTGHSTLSEVIRPKLDGVEKNLYHIYNSKGANTAGKIRDDDKYRNPMREPDEIFYDGPEDPGSEE